MTSVQDNNEQLEELAVFLRNSDIYTTTERSVTTTTATGTFAGESSLLIARTNIKNIRSVVVSAVTLTFGTDYTIDYDFLSTTIQTKITFTSAQTGAYTITYDYGTDIIFTDWPRTDLKISSFPRCSIQLIGENSDDVDLPGSTEESTITFGISVFDVKVKDIGSTHKTIKTKMIANKTGFYHLKYVRRLTYGPLLPFPAGRNKVQFKTMNYISTFNLETA